MKAPLEAPPEAPPKPRRRPWRFLAGLLVVVIILAVGARLTWSWLNPFGETSIDRSQPVLLQSIHNLSRFEAATGNFQVVVDLEKDASFLPDAVKGSRTLFVGAGGVDAYVDFGGLPNGALTMSPTARKSRSSCRAPSSRSPTSTTSAPTSTPSSAVSSTGWRTSCPPLPPTSRSSTYWPRRRSPRPRQASDLRNRADQNTKAMLQGMLGALGFDKVTVKFADEP